jgi:polyisoprenoid-binding protein YceI
MRKIVPSLACIAAAWTALAAPAGTTYVVDSAKSSVMVHVGKTGLFSFAGHEHEVRATRVGGEIVAVAQELAASSVQLTFEAGGLLVSEKDEPAGDAAKVQEAMQGPKVLDTEHFPLVTFQSKSVGGRPGAAGTYDLELTGELKLHGVTQSLRLPVHIELAGNTLKASGRIGLKHSDYGMSPISVAGVVKVKDELSIEFTIVATAP